MNNPMTTLVGFLLLAILSSVPVLSEPQAPAPQSPTYAQPTESTTQPAQKITLMTPNGGEKWEQGSTQKIVWSTEMKPVNYDIMYSADLGKSWSYVAKGVAPEARTFAWKVAAPVSEICFVRISANTQQTTTKPGSVVEVFDQSDKPFSIIKAPQ